MDIKRIKKDFHFSSQELFRILIVSLIFGVMLSFKKWGEGSVVDYNLGLENLAIFSILSFVALLIHFSVEKIYACNKGIQNEYKTNPYVLGAGLYITLLFNGFLFFLAPGYLKVETKKEKRVGKWRYRSYFTEYSVMAMSGIIANLILAGLLIGFVSNSMVSNFIVVNLMVAAFSLLPIPFTDGFHIFCASIYHYVFIIVFSLTFSTFFSSFLPSEFSSFFSSIFSILSSFFISLPCILFYL